MYIKPMGRGHIIVGVGIYRNLRYKEITGPVNPACPH